MHSKKWLSFILCFMIISINLLGNVNTNIHKLSDDSTLKKEDLLEKAYIYTLPLMLMDATYTKMTNTVEATNVQAPANQFIHAKGLADATAKNIVTPNVDTVYSQICFDLSKDAVIVELPKTGRFCMAETLDAYTNCISLINATTFENPIETFIFTGPNFKETVPDNMIEVKCPTNLAWMLIRTLSYGEDDLENIYAIQNQMNSYTLSQYRSNDNDTKPKGTFKESNNFIPVEYVTNLSLENYFSKANELLTQNPPPKEDEIILQELKEISVGVGLSFDSSIFGEEAEALWQKIVSEVVPNCIESSQKFKVQNGIWSYFGSPIAEFGTEYDYRALVALQGLGANPVSVAIYPKTTIDSNIERLNGANSYVLHFEKDEFPKTFEKGFWSITMYDSNDNLLVDNEINRYCINDRSDIIYNEDGSLDIYIQNQKPTDEKRIKNWLPAPEGEFHLYLRVYLPEDKLIQNEWKMPNIDKIA